MKEWNNKVDKGLAKNPERKKDFQTTSGIAVKRVFSPEDIAGLDYEQDLNLPGRVSLHPRGAAHHVPGALLDHAPVRRVRHRGGYEPDGTVISWTRGRPGFPWPLTCPTQIGYDSDHPLPRERSGKVGVAIDSVKDMEILFDRIPLDKVSTSMTINAPASILLAMYMVVGEKQGVTGGEAERDDPERHSQGVLLPGNLYLPPKPSMRIITNIFEYCTREVPNWNTISISGYHMREAGCTAVQEVAFTLANGIAYVEAALKAGLDVDVFAPRLSFFFNAHLDFLEEVAKFRAARRLWAKIMKERFKAKNPRSCMLRFHTQTAGLHPDRPAAP